MSLIETLAAAQKRELRSKWLVLLLVEQALLERHFTWLTSTIKEKSLFATGTLSVCEEMFDIEIEYSPFFHHRFDQIRIGNHRIKFDDEIHVYSDLTLCLYHPIYDVPVYGYMPLHKIIPWISEWCHFYCQWKKYSVWLGDEIKHVPLNVIAAHH